LFMLENLVRFGIIWLMMAKLIHCILMIVNRLESADKKKKYRSFHHIMSLPIMINLSIFYLNITFNSKIQKQNPINFYKVIEIKIKIIIKSGWVGQRVKDELQLNQQWTNN
jgi:hypothetical protein